MSTASTPTRFVGLDVHKHYLIAVAVDAQRNPVFGPQRVPLQDLAAWIPQRLTPTDAVVLEITTNTWQLYDDLSPHVHSVTVVHPPSWLETLSVQVYVTSDELKPPTGNHGATRSRPGTR